MKKYTQNEVEQLLERQRERTAFALLMQNYMHIPQKLLFEIKDLVMRNKLEL